MSRFVCTLAVLLLCAGCGTLSDPIVIPEKAMPEAFGEDSPGTSAARVDWREWFGNERLHELITEALLNNQDLLIAMQRVEKARADVRAATGALLPEASLGLGAGVRKFGLYTMDGAGNATTEIRPGKLVPEVLPSFAIALQSVWELDLWGRLRNLKEAALHRYLASIEGTNLVLTSLVADLAATYFDLVALDLTLDVLRRSAAHQTEALEVIRIQKLAGRANELAVEQFEAQVADTLAREREIAQMVTEAENRINVLLGRFSGAVPRDRSQLGSVSGRAISTGIPSDLLRNRPDIRAAELAVQATKLEVGAARAAFFPSFTITAGVGYEAFQGGLLFRTPESLAYAVAAGLTMPLLNRRALEATFLAAKADQIEAMYEYQRTIIVAYTEVVGALSNVRASEEVLSRREQQRSAMERSIATADALYRAGKATYLEVLIARQNALQAELAVVEALRRQRLANVAIYKTLGGGWH